MPPWLLGSFSNLRIEAATASESGAKLSINRVILRSPRASCKKPADSGPRAVPSDVIIKVKDTAIATSRGRMLGKWNGTVNKTGQNPQAIPFIKDKKSSTGIEKVKTMPM
jgi:hypothetical protein